MARQTEHGRTEWPHGGVAPPNGLTSDLDSGEGHSGFTQMLFVDAVVGIGFPSPAIGLNAEKGGLASLAGLPGDKLFVWCRPVLADLPLDTLQQLYVSLKTYEVTHAG